MNRTVDKEKFFIHLNHHPAAVKKVVNPTEDFLVECVTASHQCMEYIPQDKQTEKIITAYLKVNTRGYGVHTYLEGNREIAAKLPIGIVEKFIKSNTGNIVFFPQATREMWVEAAKKGLNVDFGNIPEAVVCEELLAALIENSSNRSLVQEIPERFWTENLIRTALDTDPTGINSIPKSIVTKKWVIYALGTRVITHLEIPEALWDEELAGIAADRTGLDNIPEHLRTKEICLRSIYADLFDRDAISGVLKKDKDIQLALACRMPSYRQGVVPAVKRSTFQVEALQSVIGFLGTRTKLRDVENLITNIQKFVVDWVPILKLWPEAIKYIDKPNQTTEQIQMALQSRTERDDLELIAKSLNLAKVTREMAPMLLNVEDKGVQDFVTRKLAPPKRAEGAEVNEVIVNVTPQEYNEISKREVKNG